MIMQMPLRKLNCKYFDLTCGFIINIQEYLLSLEAIVNKRDIRYCVICD